VAIYRDVSLAAVAAPIAYVMARILSASNPRGIVPLHLRAVGRWPWSDVSRCKVSQKRWPPSQVGGRTRQERVARWLGEVQDAADRSAPRQGQHANPWALCRAGHRSRGQTQWNRPSPLP